MIEKSTPTETNRIADFTEQFINQTNQCVFLTGKAGTGKTTLLQRIVENTHKQTIIVAPTGIAALNAGGVTIHSFFQLPFAGFIPDFEIKGGFSEHVKLESRRTLLHHFKMNSSKRAIVRNMELLIVDEVSMLRADVLDAMDWMLRNVRKINKPFGGVQVLFVGDLMQLPPVVKPTEWNFLRHYYAGMFFFNAHAVKEASPIYVELNKVYRQEDENFLEVLNHLRNNEVEDEDITLLNKYVQPDFKAIDHEGYVTLTTHNADADKINEDALDRLETNEVTYNSEVTGTFPEYMYPLGEKLVLKIGAQVMFVKNDTSYEKNFYNGKMGRIVALEDDEIKVNFPEEKKTITVDKYEWNNIQYALNPSTSEVEEKVLGTFVQYPLKLAWAITVHKSQGLTFDKAVIDVSKVFVPGQSYVALSRLRSLDGLVLLNPIRKNGLSIDPSLANYTSSGKSEDELQENLEVATVRYLHDVLLQSFDWVEMMNKWQAHEKTYQSLGSKSQKGKNRSWITQQVQILSTTMEPARKFRGQLDRLFLQEKVDLEFILERTKAAYDYFFKSLDGVLYSNLKKMAELQQQRGTKQYNDELEELDVLITETILRIKKAKQTLENIYLGKQIDKEDVLTTEIQNYKLAKIELVKNEMRESNSMFDFDTDFVQLKTRTQKRKEAPKKKKRSTYEQTLDMVKEGMTISEIAKSRQLSSGTISTHCARLLQQEKIELKEVMDKKKISALYDLFEDFQGGSLKSLKEEAGNKFTWDELKLYHSSLLI